MAEQASTVDQALDSLSKLPADRRAKIFDSLPIAKQREMLTRYKQRKGGISVPGPTKREQDQPFMARHGVTREGLLGLTSGVSGLAESQTPIKDVAKGMAELFEIGPTKQDTDVVSKVASYIPVVGPIYRLGANLGGAIYGAGGDVGEGLLKTATAKTPEQREAGEELAAHGAGALVGSGLAILGGEKVAPEVTAKPGAGLVERARNVTQEIAGVGPERTTRPLMEEFGKKKAEATTAQEDANKAADVDNRAKIEKYQTQKREAFESDEQARMEHTLATEEAKQAESDRQAQHQKEAADVEERNQAQEEMQTRRGQLARTINQTSKELGESISEQTKKDGLARQVGNEKYDAVSKAVAGDEGVSAEKLSSQMQADVKKWIKGSPERIKQVSTVASKSEAGAEQVTLNRETVITPESHPDAWQQLLDKGIIQPAQMIKFDDLRGFSSEIGNRLAAGGLEGDVYKALEAVKKTIDDHIADIADRHGATELLQDANAFHRQFMETFYDKPSAAAMARERVGGYDPEYYAEGFLKGKGAKTTIANLRKLASMDARLEKPVGEIADKADAIRSQNEEFQGLPKKAKIEKIPEAPTPKPLPEAPEPAKQPKRPELNAPEQIKQPQAPTPADVEAEKRSELAKSNREIMRFSKYDAAILASGPVGALMFGRWESLLLDPLLIGMRKGFGYAIGRPGVVEWLAKPSAEDIRILNELPSEVKADVKKNMQNFINEEQAHSRKVTLSPEVKQFLGATATGLTRRGKAIVEGTDQE